MSAELANLAASDEPRNVVLLYHTPLERAAIDESGTFELIADLGYGIAYRSLSP
jgi:hypothetical protein